MATAATSTRAEIDQVNISFMEAVRRGDPAGMAAVYTRNAQVLPPGLEAQTGVPAIQAFWHNVLQMGVVDADLQTVEFEERGDLAWEVGEYTLYAADGHVIDWGKYFVLWQRENGAWRWHRDIWNTSRGD